MSFRPGFVVAAGMAGLLSVVIAGSAGASALPSGFGISANYPGDAGIENHPSVVFVENFETGTLQQIRDRWGYSLRLENMQLTDDVPEGSAGVRSLQMKATRSASGAELYKTFTGPNEGWDQIFLRFNAKFAHDHGAHGHFVALRGFKDPLPFPIGGAGQRPENHFSVTIEPTLTSKNQFPSTSHGPPGIWQFYSYWPEMRSFQNPDGSPNPNDPQFFGNTFYPQHPADFAAKRGEWFTIEVMLKLNSNPNDPDNRDGELALWVDGELAVHFAPGQPMGYWMRDHFRNDPDHASAAPFEGFRWRHDEDVTINVLRLQHWISSGAWSNTDNLAAQGWDVNTQEKIVWFDNIVMATEYIGPMRPIPEPSAAALLGAGALLLLRRRRVLR